MSKLKETYDAMDSLYREISNRQMRDEEAWLKYCRVGSLEERSEAEETFYQAFNREWEAGQWLLDQYFALQAQVQYPEPIGLGGKDYLEDQLSNKKDHLEYEQAEPDHDEKIGALRYRQSAVDTFTKSLQLFNEDKDRWCDYLLEQYSQFKRFQATSNTLAQNLPPVVSEDDDRDA